MAKSETFSLTFKNFQNGAAPVAHLDSLTQIGNGGHYAAAANVDIISTPGLLTQGPGLTVLTAGTQAGAITEQVRHILGRPFSSGFTYGIAATKLHKISPSAVTNTGIWPHAITGAVDGSSVVSFQGAIYYFFNKASGADCGKYDGVTTFTDAYFSAVPTGAAALQNAPHPVDTKQNIMLFGNGRYVGTFLSDTTTLNATRLDFGSDAIVADVAFHANQWWIAVNVGTNVSTDRQYGSIFLYDPSATTALLADEIGVGAQKIGFILPIEGVMYVAYQDLTSAGGFCIGYVNGRKITPLRYFTGALPTFAQKTLYNNTILFHASGKIYSVGAVVESLPVQISQLASTGFGNGGALSAPFGTPMIASFLSTSFQLATFANFDVNCNWRSIIIPAVSGQKLGFVDTITVLTNTLGSGARCDLIIEFDQGTGSGATMQITGTGKRRHNFISPGTIKLEDFRLFLNWVNGSTTNPVKIRQIVVEGHYIEKA